jgi:VWFA-related protein
MHSFSRRLFAFVLMFGVAAMQCQTPPADSVPSFKSKVNVVLIDVVVNDHKDEPVTGLKKSNFEILEDGKSQAISVFEEHKEATANPTINKLPAMPAGVYTNSPQATNSDSVNVVLFDAVNTQSWDQAAVYTQLVKYLGNIPPGTRMAAFNLNSRLNMLTGVTTDASVLLAALTDPKAGAGPHQSLLFSSTNEMNPDDWINGERLVAGTPLASGITQSSGYGQMQAIRTDTRVEVTLRAFQQLARYLAGIPGRKNVIWFSGSFPISIFPDQNMLDPYDAQRHYSAEIKRTTGLMAAAQVAIYPIQSEGLTQTFGFNADASEIGHRRGITNTGGVGAARFRDANLITMDILAKESGGKAFYNTNGFGDAFTRAIHHGSHYYTITYAPTNKKVDGSYRSIDVKVQGGKYKLAYRRGYFAADSRSAAQRGEPVSDPLLPLMAHGLPSTTQIIFKVRVALASPQPADDAPRIGINADVKGPITRYAVDFAVAPDDLKLDAGPDGQYTGKVEIMLAAYARDEFPVNMLVQKQQITLTPDAYSQTKAVGVQLHGEIDIPQREIGKGGVHLRTGIYDLNSDNAGTLELPISTPPASGVTEKSH